jgi:hypothetical protein
MSEQENEQTDQQTVAELFQTTRANRYYCMRNCLLPAPIAFLIWGIILLTVWGLLFKLSDRNCLINNYEIRREQRCPWPDQCFNVQCVKVDVLFFDDHVSHATSVPVWYYENADMYGCSKESNQWVVADLNQRYPIGTNQTCYATKDTYDSGATVFFTDILTENLIFYLSIALFVSTPIILIVILLVLWGYKKKYLRNDYHPLHNRIQA